jgi:hypothetical protein
LSKEKRQMRDKMRWGLLLLGGCLVLWGCQKAGGEVNAPAVNSSVVAQPNPTPAPATVPFKRPAFNAENAFKSLEKQCSFGPRYLGSEGHDKCKEYLTTEMKKYADKVTLQEGKYRGMTFTNVVGVFYPEGAKEPAKNPILLLAHWDTRPIADGPNSAEAARGFRYGTKGWNRLAPIPGANDGASGGAVLLELARLFKEQRPKVGVVIALVDGEDYGDFRGNNGEGDGVLLGSHLLADKLKEYPEIGQPSFGILLDMVGAKNLVIPREENSHRFAPATNEKVFGTAQTLGYGDVFRYDETQWVEDDHMPLNRVGVPTIDLIHPLPFNEFQQRGYVYWHTLQDEPAKCSPKALKAVGETVAEVIYRETP